MKEPIELDKDVEEGNEFSRGAIVRLDGLQGAAHLNGVVAEVMRFVPETRRYEVLLRETGEVKAVQPNNLIALPLLDQVSSLRDELQNHQAPASLIRGVLKRLQDVEVTVQILQQTKIGKVVNETTKRFANLDDIAEMGRNLVRKWRDAFQNSQSSEKPKAANPKAVAAPAGGGSSDASNSASTAAAQQRSASTLTGSERCHTRGSANVNPAQGLDPESSRKRSAGQAQLSKPNGKFSQGRTNVEMPANKTRAIAVDVAQVAGSGTGKLGTTEMEPMSAADDAARLVNAMNNSPTDRVRLGILAALDKSPPAALPHFVAQGGLAVLDRWVRSHAELRLACLTSLQKMPMTGHELEVARMCNAVLTAARQDAKPEVRQKAQLLLDKWANEGLVPQALGSAPAAGSRNSPAEAQTLDASAAKVQGLPENFPSELAKKLDPRIAKVLMERPAILEFLSKHPSVMQNMNADSIAFLHRNLRNSKETLDEAMALEENEGCTVTVSNLAPRASELDVQELLERCGFGPAEVTMPRESRRQRTCGVAFAALPSRAAAHEAVRQLQGMLLLGKPLRLEIADGNAASADPGSRLDARQQGSGAGAQGASRRIQWRHDEELWDVALFDRNESVASFSDRIQDSSSAETQLQPPPENNALFEAAATRERAEERRLVREALAAK